MWRQTRRTAFFYSHFCYSLCQQLITVIYLLLFYYHYIIFGLSLKFDNCTKFIWKIWILSSLKYFISVILRDNFLFHEGNVILQYEPKYAQNLMNFTMSFSKNEKYSFVNWYISVVLNNASCIYTVYVIEMERRPWEFHIMLLCIKIFSFFKKSHIKNLKPRQSIRNKMRWNEWNFLNDSKRVNRWEFFFFNVLTTWMFTCLLFRIICCGFRYIQENRIENQQIIAM